jgi:hypothetical protein
MSWKGKSDTVYQVEYSWTRSPQVWGTLAKVFLWGIVAGIVLCIYAGCSDVTKDLKSNVPCKPTQTTSPDNSDPGSG